MLNRTCAAGALLVALSICGCATTNTQSAMTTRGTSTCLTSTGSRIPSPDTHCTATGRSYSQTDLDQTGKTTAAGALGMVDPSVTITH
jgi:hypothetical protein